MAGQFLFSVFLEYLFQIFCIGSLQCRGKLDADPDPKFRAGYKLQCQQEYKTCLIPGLADRVRRGVSGVRLGVIGRGRDLQQRGRHFCLR